MGMGANASRVAAVPLCPADLLAQVCARRLRAAEAKAIWGTETRVSETNGFDRFKDRARRLVAVPKKELNEQDEKRRAKKKAG
jgi:hypothetical protein